MSCFDPMQSIGLIIWIWHQISEEISIPNTGKWFVEHNLCPKASKKRFQTYQKSLRSLTISVDFRLDIWEQISKRNHRVQNARFVTHLYPGKKCSYWKWTVKHISKCYFPKKNVNVFDIENLGLRVNCQPSLWREGS